MNRSKQTLLLCVNFILSAFTALLLLVLVEQLFIIAPWFSKIKYTAPALIAFLIGSFYTDKISIKLMCPLSSFASACLICLLQILLGTFDIAFILTGALAAAFMYLMGAKTNNSFPQMLFFTAMGVYLVFILIFNSRNSSNDGIFKYFGLIFFLCGLISFNLDSVQSGVHNVQGGSAMKVPAGIRRKNLTLLCLFLGIALAISILPAAQSLIGSAAYGFLFLFKMLISIGVPTSSSEAPPEATAEITEPPELITDMETSNPAGQAFVAIFVISIVVVCIIGLIFMLIYSLGKNEGLLKRLSRRIRRPNSSEDYEDEVERLLDLRDLLQRRRRKGNNIFKRFFSRPERFEDMPDNRMRVRFAYKAFLKERGVPKNGGSQTPLEYSEILDEGALRLLAENYSVLKFSNPDIDIPDSAAKNAETAVRELRKKVKSNG